MNRPVGSIKLLFSSTIERLEALDLSRREVGPVSSIIIRDSKKAIFAAQRREDLDEAWALLSKAALDLRSLDQRYGASRVRLTTGSWRVAVEEFLEGLFFVQFVAGQPLTGVEHELLRREDGEFIYIDEEEVVGALSDFTGELGRMIHMWIVSARYQEALQAHAMIVEVCELINDTTTGGNVRQKVDQANRNLQHADSRVTDLRLRGLI